MERWKIILKKLLFPGWGWVCLSVLLGGASLAVTFFALGDSHPFAYLSYVLSFYALVVLAAAVIPLFSHARQLAHRVPLAHRFLTDQYFKVRSSLLLSFFINLFYAVMKFAYAVRDVSFWEGALSIYNLLLCVLRIYLIRRVPRSGQEQNREKELRYYRTTGIFLIALDLALSGIATQIVEDGQGYYYSKILTITMATYAFYSLTIAIVNKVKFRKFNSPVLSAAKAVNLTTALVAIFNLETAMLAQFGEGEEDFRLLMTACTALAMCLIVLGVAVFMVISSNRKLRRLPT